MLKRLKDLLSQQPETVKPEKTNASDISLMLCTLLLEAAHADDQFTKDEEKHITGTLKKHFSLTDEDAEELIKDAENARDDSLDLWKFTNKINESYDREGRQGIFEDIWRVIYADGTLDSHEDYLIHKMTNLLRLRHSEMIDAKVKVLREIKGE